MKFTRILYQMASTQKGILAAAEEFISYVNKSPSPYHAVDEVKKTLVAAGFKELKEGDHWNIKPLDKVSVDEVKKTLVAAGFKELKEGDHWNIKPLDKCYMTRNHSTIIAFTVGGQYKPGNGFSVVGAHTDSPCLRVKPVSKKEKEGYIRVGVECYGGGTWHTWLDRDLTVAGRVIVKQGSQLHHRLVHIDRPILRVPNIAIHLQRELGQKFEFNKETHLAPVLATTVQAELVNGTAVENKEGTDQASKHHPVLVTALCQEMSVKPEDIIDFELCLADTQPAAIGGALKEFIFSPRLDNLLNAYCAAKGLITSCDESLQTDPNIRMISLFDNEEVGSQSAQGAGSALQEFMLRRLAAGGTSTAFEEAIPKSLMVSADQAHAVHPNYSEKHEDQHKPALHKGIVVKFNANQRYATTAITTSILREIASRCSVPLQDFVVRNDSPCGSTIGPIMSAKLGMPTVDIGGPQLSMHSIREMCCTSSVQQSIDLYTGFFKYYPEVYASFNL